MAQNAATEKRAGSRTEAICGSVVVTDRKPQRTCRGEQSETVLEHFPASPTELAGAVWVLVTPQIMTKITNCVKHCTYSEQNRTCPYMIAWGVTTPAHTGDDGPGGPMRGWVGELWLLV